MVGPESFTDNSDKILINQASKFSNFSVTLYFETEIIQEMNSSSASEEAQIVSDVSYIMQNYASSDAFTQIGGRQVLFFYGVNNWPVQFWSNVTSAIHANYPTLRLISDSFGSVYLSAFDGASSYMIWLHDPVPISGKRNLSYLPADLATCKESRQIVASHCISRIQRDK